MENLKKTISLDNDLYKKSDYSEEYLKEIEKEFNECFGKKKHLIKPMTKAGEKAGHKYYKRVPKPTGKGYYYFYTQKEFKDYKKGQVKPEEETGKFNLLTTIKGLFGFSDERQAKEKIKDDYKANAIGDRFAISLDSWASHLSEYFRNKDKWAAFFSKKKEEKEKSAADKKKVGKKKAKPEKTKGLIKLSVMKTIHEMYGGVKAEPAQAQSTVSVGSGKSEVQRIADANNRWLEYDKERKQKAYDWAVKTGTKVSGPEAESLPQKFAMPNLLNYIKTAWPNFWSKHKESEIKKMFKDKIEFIDTEHRGSFNVASGSAIAKQTYGEVAKKVGFHFYLREKVDNFIAKKESPDNFETMPESIYVYDEEDRKYINSDGSIKANAPEKTQLKWRHVFVSNKIKKSEKLIPILQKEISDLSSKEYKQNTKKIGKKDDYYGESSGDVTISDINEKKRRNKLKALNDNLSQEKKILVEYNDELSQIENDYNSKYKKVEFTDEERRLLGMKPSVDTSFNPDELEAEAGSTPEGFIAEDEGNKYYHTGGEVYKIPKYELDGVEGVVLDGKVPVPLDTFLKNVENPEDNFETMPESTGKKSVGSSKKQGQNIQEAIGKVLQNVLNYIERGLFTASDFLQGQDVTKHIDKDLGKYVSNPIVWNAVVAGVKKKYFPTAEQLAEQVKEIEKTAVKRNIEIIAAISETKPDNRAEKEAEIMDYPKEPWAQTFEQYKKDLMKYRNQYLIDKLNDRIASRERMLSKIKEGDYGYSTTLRNLKVDRETLADYIEGKIDEQFKNNPSWDYLQKEYNLIKDKESPEAKSLKRKLNTKENKAKAEHERLIKNAIKDKNIIPANVLKEYPDIQNNEAKTMSFPDIGYKPVQYEKTIYLGAEETESNKRTVKINDYSKVAPKDVYLADEETILNVPRPSYIPEMDLENFAGRTGSTQNFDIVRMGPNKYIIVDKRYPVARSSENTRKEFDERSAYTVFDGKEVDEKTRMAYNENAVGKRNYFEMSAETLAATWDYYRKLYSAKERQKHEERQDREERNYNEKKRKALEAGKSWPYAPFKRSGIRPTKTNPDSLSMSFSQAFMIQDFTGLKAPVSDFNKPTKMNLDLFQNYRTMLRELEYKINDLRLQRKYDDESNTFKKGEDTSYGDAGLKDNLLQAKGVLVKRQNGTEIDDQEITKIGMLLDDIYSVFGDRSSMSQKYGLKISYAGDKRMHASKAIGVFIDHYKCIAISDTGIEGRGFTFAHEFSHFMDSYLGEKDGYHFASDKDGSIANDIAIKFRRDMNLKTNPNTRKSVGADYYNRTCECFARAMEQYYAIKQGTEKELYEKNKMSGAYIDHNKFLVKIMPLCEQFLKENDSLLKAFVKSTGKMFIFRRK